MRQPLRAPVTGTDCSLTLLLGGERQNTYSLSSCCSKAETLYPAVVPETKLKPLYFEDPHPAK